MSTPKRVQMTRNKPWRGDNPDAVIVDRRSKWGNPFRVGAAQIAMPAADGGEWEYEGRLHKPSGQRAFFCTGTDDSGMPVGYWQQIEDATVEQCITLYREWITGGGPHLDWAPKATDLGELRGRDLACWCPLEDQHGNRVPCHADVLLELANEKVAP